MFPKLSLVFFALGTVVSGQQVGTVTSERHPALPWQKCTSSGCTTQSNGAVTLDANLRWLHDIDGYTNCYTGNTWDSSLCPDGATCAANCALEGADYYGTSGISTRGNAITFGFNTNGVPSDPEFGLVGVPETTSSASGASGTSIPSSQSTSKSIRSRVYLMNSDSKYEVFQLLNKEFSFDVDISYLPCGFNGAIYFSQMDADGGMFKFPANKAGAKYGTGYCDSQCPRDIKFINGQANVEGWSGNPKDPNAGTGSSGACCNEMDVWEANNDAATFIAHPCNVQGLEKCSSDAECAITDRASGVCDPDGCDFNSFRMGNYSFYGKGLTVDTTRKFTVVTQFLTDNNSDTGNLKEIRRIYVQDGKVIQNSKTNIPGMDAYDSITEVFCDAQKTAFNDTRNFQNKGGLSNMGKALGSGMVLVLGVLDDPASNMLWLDSAYPTNSPTSMPGVLRGTCPTNPGSIGIESPDPSVTFSNIKFGDIGTTFSTTGQSTTTVNQPSSTTVSSPAATQTKYGQCGGTGYSGPTVCASGSTCQVLNQFYSQCLP